MARRSTSRAAGHALGGERLQGPSWQRVPTCRDRCRPLPTCRYGGGGVRPHDFQGQTTYHGPTGAGQTPHPSPMAPPPALALGRPPQLPHADRHRHVHHTVCWLAQSWDTRTMTGRMWSARQVRGRRRWTTRPSPPGRPRVVDAPGGGRERHNRRRRDRLRRRGGCAAACIAHAPPAGGRAPGGGVHVGMVTWLTLDQGGRKARRRPHLVPGWPPAHRGTHGLAMDARSGWQGQD
jgi:hypothetical protein